MANSFGWSGISKSLLPVVAALGCSCREACVGYCIWGTANESPGEHVKQRRRAERERERKQNGMRTQFIIILRAPRKNKTKGADGGGSE